MLRGQRLHDEIPTFEEARYLSASEAVWRLLQFDIVVRRRTLFRLVEHLENHHALYFREIIGRSAENG